MVRVHVGSMCGLALVILSVTSPDVVWADPVVVRRPAGHTRALAAQRVAVPPTIDGALTDRAWDLGAAAEEFWVSARRHAPADQTRVVVVYDDAALYIAFTCHDSRPELIRASQVTRDASAGLDDQVTVELDPHHNHRSVSRFTVTARGTQSDVLAGGRARQREWRGEWRAAARRTAGGWTAEIAIPFALLGFDPAAHTFGINFSRYQNRTEEWSEWADLTPQRLAEEAGHLTGLRLPQTSTAGRLAVMQYLATGTNAAGAEGAGREMNTGVDVRYQFGRGLTSMVSTHPDFSTTDADVPGIGFSHTEKFVSDRRPFFQEGGAFFGDAELFHSGRIESFDVGAKAFGRVDDYQVGVLATNDAASGRADYVGRVVREVGPAFNLSATVAGTRRDAVANDAVQLQAAGRVTRNLRVEANLARTSGGAAGDGTRQRAAIAYQHASWYSGGWADYTDLGYFAANGFIAGDLIGTTGRGAYGGYSRAFGRLGLRRADASMSYLVRDTTSGLRQRETASLYTGAETASNIRLNAGMTVGSYRPRGARPGEWLGTLDDDRSYLTSAFYQSPTGQFGYGAQYSWGAAGARGFDSLAPSLWVAPKSFVSFAYSFERAAYDQVRHQHVVSGTWDITSGQSLAARWVEHDGGYYRLSYRRSLAPSVEAFGVYTSDPYDPGRFDVKVVWAKAPVPRP